MRIELSWIPAFAGMTKRAHQDDNPIIFLSFSKNLPRYSPGGYYLVLFSWTLCVRDLIDELPDRIEEFFEVLAEIDEVFEDERKPEVEFVGSFIFIIRDEGLLVDSFRAIEFLIHLIDFVSEKGRELIGRVYVLK